MTEPVGENRSLGITPRERVAIIRSLPWVAELPRDPERACDGYVRKTRSNRTGKCWYTPRWRYSPVSGKGQPKHDRFYCTVHLFSRGLHATLEDRERTDNWSERNLLRVLAEIRGKKS